MADLGIRKTLEQLGTTTPEAIAAKFAEVTEAFDVQIAIPTSLTVWEAARQAWLGRKSGDLSQITENWLRAAPPQLKPIVG